MNGKEELSRGTIYILWNPSNTIWKKGKNKVKNGNIMESVNLFKIHCTHTELSQWNPFGLLLLYGNLKIKYF
jgi:hypothetical protein